tara:strand:- start:12 stop:494 length:483 start_codon:yes stop_codon:yes gene_type:complete
MKSTGRTLTISNDINTSDPAIRSILALGYRLTTIFEDDREGYAWRIDSINSLPVLESRVANFGLYSIRPDAFDSTVSFGVWAANRRQYDNSLIGSFTLAMSPNSSLRPDHMATNHLALLYLEEEDIPKYNITLSEYEITDREEIAFKIKETSQSLNEVSS